MHARPTIRPGASVSSICVHACCCCPAMLLLTCGQQHSLAAIALSVTRVLLSRCERESRSSGRACMLSCCPACSAAALHAQLLPCSSAAAPQRRAAASLKSSEYECMHGHNIVCDCTHCAQAQVLRCPAGKGLRVGGRVRGAAADGNVHVLRHASTRRRGVVCEPRTLRTLAALLTSLLSMHADADAALRCCCPALRGIERRSARNTSEMRKRKECGGSIISAASCAP